MQIVMEGTELTSKYGHARLKRNPEENRMEEHTLLRDE